MNTGLFVLGASFVLVICMTAMTMGAWAKKLGRVFGFGLCAVFFLILTIGTAHEVGYGNVTWGQEGLMKRLEAGVVYQLVSAVKDNADQVILVKKAGTSDFYALRVKEVPPKHFTLIDGKPVAIAPPAPPIGAK